MFTHVLVHVLALCTETGLQYNCSAVQLIIVCAPQVCVGSVKLYSSLHLCTQKFSASCVHKLQTNRGYKVTDRNTDFWPMIFVSYSRIRIFKIGIHIRTIFKKNIPFIRNRISVQCVQVPAFTRLALLLAWQTLLPVGILWRSNPMWEYAA